MTRTSPLKAAWIAIVLLVSCGGEAAVLCCDESPITLSGAEPAQQVFTGSGDLLDGYMRLEISAISNPAMQAFAIQIEFTSDGNLIMKSQVAPHPSEQPGKFTIRKPPGLADTKVTVLLRLVPLSGGGIDETLLVQVSNLLVVDDPADF